MVERIIDAARTSFAHNGWAGTTLRGVAREVDVDPALVHYYFSSKEELLDASTRPPQAWIDSIATTNAVPLRDRGEAVVRNVIWGWTQPEIREVLSSILITAAHEPRTREKLRAFVTASSAAGDRGPDRGGGAAAAGIAGRHAGGRAGDDAVGVGDRADRVAARGRTGGADRAEHPALPHRPAGLTSR